MLKNTKYGKDGFIARHPVLANIIVIVLVAFLGIWIVFLCLQLFTRHGESDVVPPVENMSYTQAVKTLHEKGFRVDIRDSIYKEEMKPGFVIEQFPKSGARVKPGRKIFLYINAVHPKEVVIDDDNNPHDDALRGFSFRQGMARLEELGFKNIRVVKILGDNDCIVKVSANGKVVRKTEKVPVNANIVVEVYDGKLGELRDSLQNMEYLRYATEENEPDTADDSYNVSGELPEGGDEPAEDPDPVFVQ
ncbi:MAG: PASTA domain-containing protein [Muribaculaceae bacterium]|nr:PASTA domain-containing protein [Muribaculaceae bacterium]